MATPLELIATDEPKAEPFTRNWTVPVGIGAEGSVAETLALKLAAYPDLNVAKDGVTRVWEAYEATFMEKS